MKKSASAVCSLLLLLAPIVLFSGFDLALGNPEPAWPIDSFSGSLPLIYIRSNGSVEGTDLLERNGDVYTFAGDIGDSTFWANGIIIERDNIVIDGAGNSLRCHGDFDSNTWYFDCDGKMQPRTTISGMDLYALRRTGLSVSGRSNITIKNLQIYGFYVAIGGENCANINIITNNITRNARGIQVDNSTQITAANNEIKGGYYGINIGASSERCLIAINTIENGVTVDHSNNNVIFGNQFFNDRYTAIRLINNSTDNIILNNNLTGNDFSISISHSDNNIISGNSISNNSCAIHLTGGANNSFSKNLVINNSDGVDLFEAVNNTFCSNNFINNTKQINVSLWFEKEENVLTNFWDHDKIGNYWSDYNGSDRNFDGIGDTPYRPSAVYLEFVRYNQTNEIAIAFGQDNYPLMSPVEFSGGFDDLPLWAYEKLRSLNLLEDPTQETTSEPFPTVPIAASAALAVAVGAGLVVYFKKRKR
jgi:parallel beta-helix repeat protein